MAIDREFETIDDYNNQYDINRYTIQYDSKAKRFFKGFAPKVGSGALLSTLIFAGLGVATVATGGIAGIGLASAAGIAVATGTSVQTISSGLIYRFNSSQARFKALGIGGKEDNVGTIGIIEEYESRAEMYNRLLESSPEETKFVLDDGNVYSRRKLKKLRKESEDIAYHGLKYILDQGMIATQKINALRKRGNLTEYEQESLNKYWDMLDRISLCVKKVASNRTTFNPYKALIIDALQKGCLLGEDDHQNNQIRAVATKNDKDSAVKLYSNMYELSILEGIKAEREETRRLQDEVTEEYKRVKATREQLIEHDNEISKVSASNRDLAQKINQLTEYQTLIDVARRVIEVMPAELKAEKTMLTNSVAGFKSSIKKANQAEIDSNKEALDSLIDMAQEKLIALSVAEGRKSIAANYKKAFENYKIASQAILDKQTKKYKRVVQTAVDKRTENRQLKQKLANAEADLEYTTQGWYEAEQRVEKQTKKYEGAVRRGVSKRAESKYWQGRAEGAEATVNVLNENQVELEEQNQYWQGRAEEAEATVGVIYKNQQDADAKAKNWKKRAIGATKRNLQSKAEKREIERKNRELSAQLEDAKDTVTALYDSLGDAGKTLIATEEDLERALGGWYESERIVDKMIRENEQLVSKNEETSKELSTARAKVRKKSGQLTEARNKAKEDKATIDKQAKTISEQERKIGDLVEENNNFVIAQSQNIDTIIGLEVENEKLKASSKASADLAEELGYDLHRTQRELDKLTKTYEEDFEALQDEKDALEKKLKEQTDRADLLQAREDQKAYNFMRGGVIRRFNALLDKVDAHIEYTKEVQEDNYDHAAVGELRHYVTELRAKNIDALDVSDIEGYSKLLKAVYGVHSKKLAKASAKTLKQVAEEMHTLEVVDTDNLSK